MNACMKLLSPPNSLSPEVSRMRKKFRFPRYCSMRAPGMCESGVTVRPEEEGGGTEGSIWKSYENIIHSRTKS